jgi:predicted O-methyltransferase YrrM
MKFSQDWFSANIPTFEKIKQETRIRTVLEIGVYEGMSTCWMLDKFLPEDGSIICIDPLNLEGYNIWHDNVYEVKKDSQYVHLCLNKSDKVLPLLLGQKRQFDFIYIDGSHEAADVLFDAVNCWHLLRPEGIMLFDDYGGGDTVKPAVDAFLYCLQGKYKLLERGYQLAMQKLSDSPSAV